MAQVNLIKLLLETAQLRTTKSERPLNILDVGCGVGGTSRYLATELGATVTGITISTKQVEMARRLTKSVGTSNAGNTPANAIDDETDTFMPLGQAGGRVKFLELDAEQMGEHFAAQDASFDIVWISEALSHFPNKPLFFANAQKVLNQGGKLVIADWFKNENVGPGDADIKAIEDGMLLPPLCAQQQYVEMAKQNGLQVLGGPKDISEDVKQTW